jgi:WD40 repeat protein
VAFSPDGKTLATTDWARPERTVRLWDITTREQIGTPLIRRTSLFSAVAFSPDGGTLATAAIDDPVRLWNVRTRSQIGAPLNGHGGSVNTVAFSPDGRTLATGGHDGTVWLWDVSVSRRSAILRLRHRRPLTDSRGMGSLRVRREVPADLPVVPSRSRP